MARQTGSNATAQAVVVGAGPAGLTAAIALAVGGIETVLVAKRPERPDNRTSALLAGSVAALEVLGVWDACRAHAAPLRTIRLVDDTRRLLRAPEVSFSADEIDLEAYGHNIENRHLVASLEARAAVLANLTRSQRPIGFHQNHPAGLSESWLTAAALAIHQLQQLFTQHIVPKKIG